MALALSGCSSPADNGTEENTGAASGSCVDEVESSVSAAMEPNELVAPTDSLDLDSLSGKSIWYITNSQNQFSAEMSAGVEEAGEAAGVEITVFDGQNSTSRYSEGISQAIARGADGIILMAVQPAVVAEDLVAAAEAGVAVLSTLNTNPDDEVAPNTIGNFTADYSADGRLMGEWALYDSECSANAVVVQSSPVNVWNIAAEGIVAAFDEHCPDDCAVEVLDIDPANIATDTGAQLQTALQVDSSIDYVLPVWDSAIPYVAPAVAATGSNAKVLAHDGISASLEMIAAGQDQYGTVAMAPPGWIGWAAFDSVARAVAGQELPGYVIPTRLVTPENIGDGTIEDAFPNFDNYQAVFEDSWGN